MYCLTYPSKIKPESGHFLSYRKHEPGLVARASLHSLFLELELNFTLSLHQAPCSDKFLQILSKITQD